MGFSIMKATPDPLLALIEKTALEDRAAFAALYELSAGKLYSVILRILHEPSLAEEVMQEVYIKIWEKAALYNPEAGRVISWMTAIARNQAIDVLRRRESQLRRASLSDEVINVQMQMIEGLTNRTDVSLQITLTQCLNEIDVERRQMVLLAYYNGWSREELAERYKLPTGTVKSWLRRSLQALRDCLESKE